MGVFLIGIFLRFYHLSELAMFVGDQGRDYLAARDILINQRLTLIGPQTSIPWLHLGSIFYYFLALFLWLGNFNPVWPIYGTALFGVLAIYLIYVLGKNLFNQKVGLIAAFFYAISPFAILQSRISLHPSIYPVFVIIFLWSLGRLLKRGDGEGDGEDEGNDGRKYWVWLTISFLVAIQLHLSAVLLIPIFVLSWEQIKLKSRYILKLFFAAAGMMVVWKIFRHSPFTPISFWWKMFQEIFSFGNIFGAILALGVVIVGGVRDVRDVGVGFKLLKISLLATVLGLTIKNSSAEHYFNLFLPIIILVFSYGLSQFLKFKQGRILIFSICFFFLITNYYLLITSSYFFQFYSPSLSQRIKLAEFIVEDSAGQPFILKRCGPLWDFASTNMNYEYLVWWLGIQNKRQSKIGVSEIVYYIFEPKEAWETKEGCLDVGVNKSFEFEQAILVKKNADSLLR